MSGRDVALTGIPRGGTTLACRLLGGCADTVSLFEPMDVMALPAQDREAALDAVAGFYRDARRTLVEDGTAPSKQRDGEVPDNPFGARGDDGRRAALVQPGRIRVAPPPAGFTLVVKHNAAFTALLPELARHMDVLAIVRNPVAVLASWHSVDLPVTAGRVPAGEHLDAELRAQLDAVSDVVERQILLLDWFFERYQRHLPPSRVIAYERIVATGGDALSAPLGLRPAEPMALASRNANPLYDSPALPAALQALLACDGAWLRHYPRSELEAAATALSRAAP